ncbi:hypothetical protein EBZ80_03430 [bacterium]|nr:hypothetical protein [bacterium]
MSETVEQPGSDRLSNKRLQNEIRNLNKQGYTVERAGSDRLVVRKDDQEFHVTIPKDYPFVRPGIQKHSGARRWVYTNPRWGPWIRLKQAFQALTDPQERLFRGGQRARFRDLVFDSPFVSLSLLKPVASYPDEATDFELVPYIIQSENIKRRLAEKDVEMMAFDHKGIVLGIYRPAFRVLCEMFGFSVEEGHNILFSDIDEYLSMRGEKKQFLQLCYADLFKKEFSERDETRLRGLTDMYLDRLRERGILTIEGHDYETIHNDTLVFPTQVRTKQQQQQMKR